MMILDILYIGQGKLELKDFELLEHANIIIKNVNDAISGLIELKYKQPKLVLLNMDLIKINAFDCLKIIRQNPQYYHIKIGMISHIENFTQIENAFNYGADYFLITPITAQTLLKILDNINYQAFFKDFENVLNRYNFS
ncbi:MAG TPA: response regulator [Bacilli bacterium]|nr:response regulator [Bacilli bacterium]